MNPVPVSAPPPAAAPTSAVEAANSNSNSTTVVAGSSCRSIYTDKFSVEDNSEDDVTGSLTDDITNNTGNGGMGTGVDVSTDGMDNAKATENPPGKLLSVGFASSPPISSLSPYSYISLTSPLSDDDRDDGDSDY